MNRYIKTLCFILALSWFRNTTSAVEPVTLNVWPNKAPGETRELPPEANTTKADGRTVAGKPVVRLGNVSTPQVAVFRPEAALDTGAAVLICPGGGHNILAYDLEGTEVAAWLNTLGITGIVLKYRVPFRDPERKWYAPVQDAQRALSLIRSEAAEWKIDPKRIGVMGFSAGGEVACRTALATERFYQPIDRIDQEPCRADFSMLIYPAYLVDKAGKLRDDITVTKQSPPLFAVHAFDDGVTPLSTLELTTAYKRTGVTAEAHIFATGGHGYGLRQTSEAVTGWPARAAGWLKERKLLQPSTAAEK